MRGVRFPKLRQLALAAATACLLTLLCSSVSPLGIRWHESDLWNTSIVGHCVADGDALYVDIADQRGPLLYLVWAAFWLFGGSKGHFYLAWVLEVGCLATAVYLGIRTVEALGRPRRGPWLALLVLSLVPVYPSYLVGDPEIMLLPPLMMGSYLIARLWRGLETRPSYLLSWGVGIGCALWTKWTWLLAFGGQGVAFLVLMRRGGRLGEFPSLGRAALVGLVAISVPPIAYLCATGTWEPMANVYLLGNAGSYRSTWALLAESRDLPGMLHFLVSTSLNTFFVVLAWLVYILVRKDARLLGARLPIAIELASLVVCCSLQAWTYYRFPFVCMFPFAVAFLEPPSLETRGVADMLRLLLCATACFYLVLACLSYPLLDAQWHSPRPLWNQAGSPGGTVAARIDHAYDSTLVERYESAGIYEILEIRPPFRFVARFNATFDEFEQEYAHALESRSFEWVVTTGYDSLVPDDEGNPTLPGYTLAFEVPEEETRLWERVGET